MSYSHSLYWKNFNNNTQLTSITDSTISNFLIKSIEDKIVSPLSPHIVYTGNGRIESLETLTVDKEFIKRRPISIYLVEPLCLYIEGGDRSHFYSEFKSSTPINTIRATELDSINKFIEHNNLTNVNVFTCDYNSHMLQTTYTKINFFCYDLFIRSFVTFNKKIASLTTKKDYTFFSSNWRFTPHRHLIMCNLHKKNGLFSWGFDCDPKYIYQYAWLEPNKLPSNTLRKIIHGARSLTPMSIDVKMPSNVVEEATSTPYPNEGNTIKVEDPELLLHEASRCYIAVINESRYGSPFPSISEKTLNMMCCKLPFIIVAGPFVLEYLKKLGFKTFDKWWDESYDQEIDHTLRIAKIMRLLDQLNQKTSDELIEMYNDMKDVIQHNSMMFETLPQNKIFLK